MIGCKKCGTMLIASESLASRRCVRCRLGALRLLAFIIAVLCGVGSAGAGETYKLQNCRNGSCDWGSAVPVGMLDGRQAWATVAHATKQPGELKLHIDGRTVPAKVEHRDTSTDFALLTTAETVQCATSTTMKLPPIGTNVMLCGFPGGKLTKYPARVSGYSPDRESFFVNQKVEQGTSGGPVVYEQNGRRVALGVVSGTSLPGSSSNYTVCTPLRVAQRWFNRIRPCPPVQVPRPPTSSYQQRAPITLPREFRSTSPQNPARLPASQKPAFLQMNDSDIARVADEVRRKYGDEFKADSPSPREVALELFRNHREELTPNIAIDQVAATLARDHGDKLRGRDGDDGDDGAAVPESRIKQIVSGFIGSRLPAATSTPAESQEPPKAKNKLGVLGSIITAIHPELRVPLAGLSVVGPLLLGLAFRKKGGRQSAAPFLKSAVRSVGSFLGQFAKWLLTPFLWLLGRSNTSPTNQSSPNPSSTSHSPLSNPWLPNTSSNSQLPNQSNTSSSSQLSNTSPSSSSPPHPLDTGVFTTANPNDVSSSSNHTEPTPDELWPKQAPGINAENRDAVPTRPKPIAVLSGNEIYRWKPGIRNRLPVQPKPPTIRDRIQTDEPISIDRPPQEPARLEPTQGATNEELNNVLSGREPLKVPALARKPADYSDAYVATAFHSGISATQRQREFELHSQAWIEIEHGSLVLPGIDDPADLATTVRHWIRYRWAQRINQQQSSHVNHEAFLGVLFKQVPDLLRTGIQNEAGEYTYPPNPPAARVIEDWVAQQLAHELTGINV